MLGLVMYLYGFPVKAWVKAVFPWQGVHFREVIELYGLAEKYDLPDLANDTEDYYDDMLNHWAHGAMNPDDDYAHHFNCLASTAAYLYANTDVLDSPLLDSFLTMMRAYWSDFLTASPDNLHQFLIACPRLAADLLLAGSFQPRIGVQNGS